MAKLFVMAELGVRVAEEGEVGCGYRTFRELQVGEDEIGHVGGSLIFSENDEK